jgi:hypothetical protein
VRVVKGHFIAGRPRFDASRPRVAGEYVPPGDDQFRFDLPPGQYEIEVQLTKHSAPVGCSDAKAVSVRANRTIHVTFVAAVLNAGCGTY